MKVDHCYSDIGCFPLGQEFYHPKHRPINVRPWHRRLIKTEFELYNAQHPDGFILRPWNKLNLIESNFDPLLETKIIVPGWLDNIKRAVWVLKLKDAFQWLWHPVNIIVVDWRNFTPYTIATANTRVVGAELANLLKFIENELNYDRSYYHIIGHSLGAHIGGYCGDRIAGLGRITALDPARPFFQGMPKVVRLDRGDAKFVDAIHSDFTPENAIFLIMSYGMTTPVGHLDFYPNGPPLLQPGCLRDTLLSVRNGIRKGLEHSSLSVAFLESLRYLTACDHQRSHEWFIESITNRQCLFVGVRCNEFDGLINGQCTCDNSPSACAIMGIHADQMYINNAHQDLWPLRNTHREPDYNINNLGRHHHHHHHHHEPLLPPHISIPSPQLPPTPPTLISTHLQDLERFFTGEQLIRPQTIGTRDDIYAEMKHQASMLRQPPQIKNAFLDELANDLETLRDEPLLQYLRANLLGQPTTFRNDYVNVNDNDNDSDNLVKRQDFIKQDIEYMFDSQVNQHDRNSINEHPKLMSDLDRDIEQWYEGSSRWFLKTNSRPNYCANQYQILVYLGPLKSSRGFRRIRANLIISIIGSRGQLMNQRFIPRSANLDSFTMQPFFVLLESSYSLGNIVSVAIGWEARLDPDPVQATISFQSPNLLTNIQSAIPAYHARHPLLSETAKYDYSSAFKWNQPAPASQYIARKMDDQPQSKTLYQNLEGKGITNQRSHLSRKINSILSRSGGSEPANMATITKRSSIDDSLLMEIDNRANELCSQDGMKYTQHCQMTSEQEDPFPMLSRDSINTFLSPNDENFMDISDEMIMMDQDRDGEQEQEEPRLSIPIEQFYNGDNEQQLTGNADHVDFIKEFLAEPKLKAELHNIGADLNNHDAEDSIVITEVRVSPLQAHYGKNGPIKVGKTFCPPHQNYKLGRDQTIKLRPSLIGKCRLQNGPHPLSRPMEVLV